METYVCGRGITTNKCRKWRVNGSLSLHYCRIVAKPVQLSAPFPPNGRGNSICAPMSVMNKPSSSYVLYQPFDSPRKGSSQSAAVLSSTLQPIENLSRHPVPNLPKISEGNHVSLKLCELLPRRTALQRINPSRRAQLCSRPSAFGRSPPACIKISFQAG